MLFLNTVSPTLLHIIRIVSAEPTFDGFRLVGGTALSLQLGHRLSVDADFFSESRFDIREAEARLGQVLPGFTIIKASEAGFMGVFEGVKLDLYTWNMPFLSPTIERDGLRMASLPDIAALKLDAVIGRKEEKDFRDIHALLAVFPLAQLLTYYNERVPHRDLRLVIDHLSAAPAADRQFSIELLKDIPYEEVAETILRDIREHLAELKAERIRASEERLQKRIDEIQKKKN